MAKTQIKNIFKDTDIRKLPINHTPVGIAAAVFLTEPSTEYDEDGQYFIRLKFKTGTAECEKLITLIDEARQQAFDAAMELLESPKEKKNLKLAEPSYKEEEDEDGNPTGFTVFNFKRKAIRTDRKGNVKDVKIPLYDSVLQPIIDRENLEIWSGSELAIAFRLTPYYTERIGVGVSHRIEAVQILKAVSGGDNRKGEDFGFKAQSGGFTGGEEEEEQEEEETPTAPRSKVKPAAEDNGDY